MVLAPPVVKLAVLMLVGAVETVRLSVELVRVRLLIGEAAVPAVPERVIVASPLIAAVPPPFTIVLAISAPPLILIVPAVPGVSVPVTAARVSVLLTIRVAFEPTFTALTVVLR